MSKATLNMASASQQLTSQKLPDVIVETLNSGLTKVSQIKSYTGRARATSSSISSLTSSSSISLPFTTPFAVDVNTSVSNLDSAYQILTKIGTILFCLVVPLFRTPKQI